MEEAGSFSRSAEGAPARGVMRAVYGPSYLLEVRQALEEAVARVDLGAREREQAVQAEGLDRERGQRAAHDHRAPQRGLVHRRAAGQVAEEPSREGVAGARGGEDLLEGIGGRGERGLVAG